MWYPADRGDYKWTAQIEYKFLTRLLKMVDCGQWDGNPEHLQDGRQRRLCEGMNCEFDIHHQLNFYQAKINQLRDRFFKFGNLLEDPSVKWDPMHNTMEISVEQLQAYSAADRGYLAYQWHGEPMFFLLRGIFYIEEDD
ncbi:uncharacterized protein LOC131013689 [Salvia miltiorrhiza]|nr:uncharacterized protein LOC131010733 [Salvia miltiorrhiza]XP_057797799.1 uncharacterized protein LOC131013689 [Salvia miltiorrhiza]